MSCEATLVQPAEGGSVHDVRRDLALLHAEAWSWAVLCCRGDRQGAHDVLHDAYVQILSGRATFKRRSSFKTWVFGVIRVVAMATRRRRLLRDFLFEPIGPVAESIAAPEVAPRAPPRLLAAMRALPRRQNEIVTLVFAHDLTLEEAASVMSISIGAARQHHARAKQKLRAALIDLETSHE
jgi:RNA polymerase sigma-70 factor (ECF subfamily)